MTARHLQHLIALCLPLLFATAAANAQTSSPRAVHAWDDKTLSPDRRADLVLSAMSLDEKLQMVHGTGWGVLKQGTPVPADSNHGAGFVPGIARLGIPKIDLADSAVGVRMAALDSHYATLLPSVMGLAATWDPAAAHLFGEVIGRELRDQGSNMSIGGGMDLTREPRNGRNFEYAGEDPVLAGIMVGNLAMGVQSQHIMGDIKHFALNDQETNRTTANVVMDKRTMRETDLLAFEIAIKLAQPAGVMCAYEKVNGDYACENDYLLNQVLKKEWGFKGWVLSDWEATHSTVKAVNAGLDQEMPGKDYFGNDLREAVASGTISMARLDDMVHRILRSMFAAGVVDDPPVRRVTDPFRGRDDARHIAQESIVLLKNQNSMLPLRPSALHRVAIIGGHADVGVLSGGGSAQVDPPGGDAVTGGYGTAKWRKPTYFPSSPLRALRALAPSAHIDYASGADVSAAAQLARSSDVAIVFVTQPTSESVDVDNLSLPDAQDALVAAVAAANPHTIVVLETGGPVTMPWLAHVPAVLAAWYPGIGGGEAIADLLCGVTSPSGKLPISFPRTEADLPQPTIAGSRQTGDTQQPGRKSPPPDILYREGTAVGYRWYEVSHQAPLFAFGHGLSYTSFRYSDLHVDRALRTVSVRVTNTGSVPADEVAQIYVRLPATSQELYQRLAGWQRVHLAPGESETLSIAIDPVYISIFNEKTDHWQLLGGRYEVGAGGGSDAIAAQAAVDIHP